MALWQGRSSRKITGGKYRHIRKKKKFEIGGEIIHPTIGGHKTKKVRVMGGNFKVKITSGELCNVWIPQEKKAKKVKLITETENPANSNYVQRNIITKGAIIKTEIGQVRITSRPGQDGVLNGVLLETNK